MWSNKLSFALSEVACLALVPEIVVRLELNSGSLKRYHRVEGLREKFYAITASRKFPNPWVEKMVKRFGKTHDGS